MTPEIVEYYRLMLLVGLGEKFYQAFERILEQEETLPDLILSLSTCISDEAQVLAILREYTLDHAYDEQTVCDLVLDDLLGRYQAGELSRGDVVHTLGRIVHIQQKFWQEPWHSHMGLTYALELWQDKFICEEVFNKCFDAWFFSGQHLNAWTLQAELTSK